MSPTNFYNVEGIIIRQENNKYKYLNFKLSVYT